jgi:hypothetical protein
MSTSYVAVQDERATRRFTAPESGQVMVKLDGWMSAGRDAYAVLSFEVRTSGTDSAVFLTADDGRAFVVTDDTVDAKFANIVSGLRPGADYVVRAMVRRIGGATFSNVKVSTPGGIAKGGPRSTRVPPWGDGGVRGAGASGVPARRVNRPGRDD